MRNFTFFLAFCVALTTVLAIPAPEKYTKIIRLDNKANKDGKIGTSSQNEFSSAEFATRDFMSDIIYFTLGISAGEFLVSIDFNLRELKNLINLGVIELNQFLHNLDQNTQNQIENLINDALTKALTIIRPILSDLGLVLPSITRRVAVADISDLIRALIGKTLHEWLVQIHDVMQQSDVLLTVVLEDLLRIANTISNPTISNGLKEISYNYLEKGRGVIRPVMNDLRDILPMQTSDAGVLGMVVSEAMGFDVVESSVKLEKSVEDAANILTNFVTQINDALIPHNPKVQRIVNELIKESIEGIHATIKPIEKVMMQFHPLRTEPDNQDISSSLLGVSLEDFLNYIDFAQLRVQTIYEQTVADVKEACRQLHPATLFKIHNLIHRTMGRLEGVINPFLVSISPILGERTWISVDEFVENSSANGKQPDKVFCNFSFSTGLNKDLIIHLVSKIFDFNVVEAAKEMDEIFVELDPLYMSSAVRINELLRRSHSNEFIINEVNRILTVSQKQSHGAIMPLMDVLVQFVPNERRHHKDIITGIIRSINGLSFESFKEYAKSGTKRLSTVANNTMSNIHHVVKFGKSDENSSILSEDLANQVDRIMIQTLEASEAIAGQFVEIISPILMP